MKIGDKIKIKKHVYLGSDKPYLKKGEIHTIKYIESFPMHAIVVVGRELFKIWREEYELIENNHPQTNIFK